MTQVIIMVHHHCGCTIMIFLMLLMMIYCFQDWKISTSIQRVEDNFREKSIDFYLKQRKTQFMQYAKLETKKSSTWMKFILKSRTKSHANRVNLLQKITLPVNLLGLSTWFSCKCDLRDTSSRPRSCQCQTWRDALNNNTCTALQPFTLVTKLIQTFNLFLSRPRLCQA